MGFTPPLDSADALETLVMTRHTSTATLPEAHAPQGVLRFGGLALDARTGVTYWRGRVLELSLAERELLTALLRRAGQIVRDVQLAVALGEDVAAVDARVGALRAHLQREGVTCLPCEASGVGYILWRC